MVVNDYILIFYDLYCSDLPTKDKRIRMKYALLQEQNIHQFPPWSLRGEGFILNYWLTPALLNKQNSSVSRLSAGSYGSSDAGTLSNFTD